MFYYSHLTELDVTVPPKGHDQNVLRTRNLDCIPQKYCKRMQNKKNKKIIRSFSADKIRSHIVIRKDQDTYILYKWSYHIVCVQPSHQTKRLAIKVYQYVSSYPHYMYLSWLSCQEVEGMLVLQLCEVRDHSSCLRFNICEHQTAGYFERDVRTFSS